MSERYELTPENSKVRELLTEHFMNEHRVGGKESSDEHWNALGFLPGFMKAYVDQFKRQCPELH